jgi:hypothetical protein
MLGVFRNVVNATSEDQETRVLPLRKWKGCADARSTAKSIWLVAVSSTSSVMRTNRTKARFLGS